MAQYPKSAVTSKKGTNHVRTTVENSGSLFIKIEQDNDLGIDAFIELIKDGKPLNQHIAVQIKSGQSYYNADLAECMFPVGEHRDYWLQHRLPVLGIVYVPILKTAHWVDIKQYLKTNPKAATIRYRTSNANRFDSVSFAKLFIPKIVGTVPSLSLKEALALARSSKLDEVYLGIFVLFRRYSNVLETWDEIVRCFRARPRDQISYHLIYFLAHVPGHGDIFYYGEQLTPETRKYASELLSSFSHDDVVKLLNLIDPETSVSRGSIGQSVDAIISSLPMAGALLREVINSPALDMFVRECAALILAAREGSAAADAINKLAASGSWHASEILSHLKEQGYINPYA